MENSKIEWCHHTFNPWMGCTKVSPACQNCYAERDMDHRFGRVAWGPSGNRVVTSRANWSAPVKWDRDAGAAGIRERVFCASLADVFEDWSGPMMSSGKSPVILSDDWKASTGSNRLTMDDVRNQLFELIDSTPNLDWLLLTKRPENIRRMWPDLAGSWDGPAPYSRKNVWIGCSVENQQQADERIPELLKCRALSPVLFLSCEPLLEHVLLGFHYFHGAIVDYLNGEWSRGGVMHSFRGVDWVIAGGESGPNARRADPDWFRSLRDQCAESETPFLFKQWGEFSEGSGKRVGKAWAGRMLDGQHHNEFPSPNVRVN